MNLEVYCTACSTQSGKNKNSVKHIVTIDKANVIPTKKKQVDGSFKNAGGYRAEISCPVTGKKISTFLKKSNAEEILKGGELEQDAPSPSED